MMPNAPQLRAARAWLGLSLSQGAHCAGVHRMTLARAEHGVATVSAHSIEAIAAAYGARGITWLGSTGIERRSS